MSALGESRTTTADRQPPGGARRTPAWARLVSAVVLATLVAAVGLSRVTPEFPRFRQVLLRQRTAPGPDGHFVQALPAASEPRPVLIVRATGSDRPARLDVRVNGNLVATAELRPRTSVRLDVHVPGSLPAEGALDLSSAPGWRLDYLEAGNLHGFSSGVFNAVIAPAGGGGYPKPAAWLILLLLPALTLLRSIRWWGPPALPRTVRAASLVLGAAVLALVLVAPIVSRFAVVLELPTYRLCLVLLYLAPAVDAYRAGRAWLARRWRAAAVNLDSAVVALAISGFFVGVAVHGVKEHEGNYSGFLYLTPPFAAAPVLDDQPELRRSLVLARSGYDGQFMFLMAFDPFLTRLDPPQYSQVVDSPAYRYGRIGFSALTRLVSGGNPAAFTFTMVWLVVLGHVAAGFFLLLLARQAGASPWQALAYVLVPGFLVSVARALPEPITAALLLAGLWAWLGSRTRVAIACWSLSLLVRETGIILILAVVAHGLWTRRPRRDSLWLLTSFVPMVAWRLYVGWRLAPAFGARAWWDNPDDLTLPLLGFVRLWRINDAAHGLGQAYNVVFPLLLIAAAVLAIAVWKARPGPAAGAAVAYALLAVSLDYRQIWSWLGNGERGTYEAFLLLLVATLPAHRLPRRLRWALAAFAAALFVYDFSYATHCTWFRPALLIFG